jgi:serine/threonine-protein kinase
MSPEQITSSRDVDFRTDIWSLGIILHELISAQPPYMADTAPALMVAIAVNPPAPLRAHRPDAPAGLEAVVLRCLEKNPNRRYADVGELALALAPFAGSGGMAAAERARRVLGTSGGAQRTLASASQGLTGSRAQIFDATATADTGAAWSGTGSTFRKNHRGRWLALACASVLLAAAAIFGLGSWSSDVSAVDAGAPGVSASSAAVIASALPVVRDEPSVVPVPAARDEPLGEPPEKAADAVVTPARPSALGRPKPVAKNAAGAVAKEKEKPSAPQGKELFDDPD